MPERPANRIWNKEIETMPRAKMRELQLERLKYIVDYCINNVEFYNKKLTPLGICGDKIKTLEDIKYIPFTVKTDLRDNYPFGLFAAKRSDIVRIHASSGTTGKPTVVGYTKSDLENWAELIARVVTAGGATSDDIVQICFGYGMFTGALGLHYGLEKIGAAVVPTSSGNTQKQLMFMRDFGTTGIVATPSYAMYLAESARALEFPMSDYRLRIGLLGSEGCTEALRNQIESTWNIFVTDNYGLSEVMGPGVSGDCVYRTGQHINEDHFLVECLDKNTMEPVPEGEPGEIVITTLTKQGIPLLRYRTKDISALHYDACPCGRTSARMEKIKGRTDDMLKIRGVNVFPSQVESVLVGMDQISTHYKLVVRREGYTDTLEVCVELIDGSLLERYGELEKLQKKIKENLRSVLGLDAKITLVSPNTIERFQGKAVRVVDLRNESK